MISDSAVKGELGMGGGGGGALVWGMGKGCCEKKSLWGGHIWPKSEYEKGEKLWQDLGKEHSSQRN